MDTMLDRLKTHIYNTLRWSERYTKTDMVYVASGGFWTTATQVVVIFSSIPLSIAFANWITPHEYGVYRYILTVSTVISAFSLTGLPIALARAAARGFEGSLHRAFMLNLRWSIPMVVIAFFASGYYALQENYVLAFGMGLIGLFMPLLNSGGLFGIYLSGKRDFRANMLYTSARTVFHTVLILAVLFVVPNLFAILFTYFAVQTASAFYYYRKIRKRIASTSVDPEMENLSKHLSLMKLVGTVAEELDSLFLFQYIGGAELAVYSFAQMVPDVMSRFIKNISVLALPKFALRTDTRGIGIKSFFISLLLLPPVLLYIIFAPYIFELFFPAYMASVPLTQALSLLLLINGALPSAYLDSKGAIRAKYIINIAVSVVKIVSVSIGVLLFGIWGAVFARFVSRIFATIANFVALHYVNLK